MKRLHITQHLSVEELEQRQRQAEDPIERAHWHVIWLQAQGHEVKTIAQMTPYSSQWIYTILHRYDKNGIDGVGDHRHKNPGQAPRVPPVLREKLALALEDPAPDGGLWTGKKVAAWLAQELGVAHINPGRGWEMMRKLGYRSYVPRPRHRKSDPQKQAEWKKKLPERIKEIRDAHANIATWELWAMDEHRIGLKPIVRRIWARKGNRPIVTVHHRYKWQYLYGFVCPESGETFWLILPTVSVEVFSQALAELATFLGVGTEKHLILVMDQAGWHTSANVVIPYGIHIVFQPAYSPEVQPSERLWDVSDEVLVNRCFETIEDLVNAQENHCRTIRTQQEAISSRTLYHWWPLLP